MSLRSRTLVGVAMLALALAAGTISQRTTSALDAGHLNPWYWPAFSNDPMTTVNVYECINQNPGGGVWAWNLTGLTNYSAPISSCSPPSTNRVYFRQTPGAACEGFTGSSNDWTVTWMREPESGNTPFYPTVAVDIDIPTGCGSGGTVYVHELGHANGLADHYPKDVCRNNVVPRTVMDCPGYTKVQPQIWTT